MGWGWGKAGNTAQLSPAGAGAWAELGKNHAPWGIYALGYIE